MAVQVSFPGVYVQEVASGVRTIAGVATSVAAFVGMTSRGRMDEPTRVLSYAEYARVFGEETTAGEMTHQVLQFFLNGGQTAWITRIAQGALASAVTLNSDVEPVLTLTARDPGRPGDTIKAEVSYDTPTPELTFNLRIYRETIDGAGRVTISDLETIPDLSMNPNSPRFVETIVAGASSLVTATSVATAPANNEGFSFSGLVLPTDPDDAADALRLRWTAAANAFRLSVGGQRFIDVTLPAPPAGDITVLLPVIENAITARLTAEGLAGPVNVQTEDIGAGPDGQVLVVRSATNGPVEIRTAAQQDVAAALQLGVGQGGVESDRFARARPAPNGYFSRIHSSTALNGGQDLARLGSFAATAQNSLTTWNITDAASAAPRTGPVAFFRPAAAPATSPMFVGTAYVPAAGDPALGSLQNARQNLGALAAAIMAGAPDAWDATLAGYRLILTPKFGGVNADATATFTTAGGFTIGAGAEMFGNTGVGALKPSNVRAYSLGVAGAGTFQGTPIAGSNGTLPAIAQYRNAFGEIERKTDIFNLLILPRARDDTNTQADAARRILWGEASAFCQRRRAFLIVDPPSDGGDWDSVNEVAAPGTGIEGSRTGVTIDHAAIYWPRLSVADPVTGADIIIDPAGTIAGLYASIDARRGVWKAPAGLEATLRGVRGVQHRIGDRENGVINPMAVNAIRMLPTGVVVWGARTMAGFDNSGFDDWRYVPVRRLALNIEESLYRGLQFAVFEPNDEPLWAQIRLAAGAFMNTLFRQGAFKGERKSDAYFVKCDEETTTQNDINLGIVNVVVGFAPLKPAEFVIITIRQMAGQIEV